MRGNWIGSAHCISGGHCGPCRNSRAFRETLVRDDWHIPEIDFACPWDMKAPSPNKGPGERLAKALKRLGFKECDGCQCRSMVIQMNVGGASWCLENIEEILDVMRDSSTRPKCNPLGVPFSEFFARRLVMHCIR